MLQKRHIEELKRSGISPKFAKKNGVRSIGAIEARKLLKMKANIGPGMLFEYTNDAGVFSGLCNFKPDTPFQISSDKVAKYLVPRGQSCHLYILKSVRKDLDDPTVDLILTEGEKKTLVAVQEGFPTVGLSGVWNWSKEKEPIDDFNKIVLKGRTVYIVFDSDKFTNDMVLLAEKRLAEYLTSKGARVKIVNLPGKSTKLDDYLVEHGSEELNKILRTAEIFRKDFNPNYIATIIQKQRIIIHAGGDFYEYKSGVYKYRHEKIVWGWIRGLLKNEFTISRRKEVIHVLETDTYVNIDALNSNRNMINFQNGFLELNTVRLRPHDSKEISTIQIPLKYDPKAKCKLWKKVLSDIFENDQGKIDVLQEYFGYCLKADNKQQKALLCVGKGANGKSLLFSIFRAILGEDNCSAVPLQALSNRHYLASLHGKLANISLEAQSKDAIHDANFKAIVAGDVMAADRKYKPIFEFRPFVRLLFAMNDLPRVDDKTDAFFRRLIILRFTRVFSEQEQDKDLEQKLMKELPGILNWMIDGLKRLERRGYFLLTEDIEKEITNYRMENNNVLNFVEEECQLYDPSRRKKKLKKEWDQRKAKATYRWNFVVSKRDLYERYRSYCEQSGYRPLSKIQFGKRLKESFGFVQDAVCNSERVWENIGIKKSQQK